MSAEDVRGKTMAARALARELRERWNTTTPAYLEFENDPARDIAGDVLASDWLAEYVATKQAEAVTQVADAWQQGGWSVLLVTTKGIKTITQAQAVTDWLRARADRIANPEAGA